MPGLINIVVYVWRSKIYYGLDLCFVVFDTLHTHSSIIFCYVLLVGVVGLVFKSALRFFSPSPHKVSIYFSGWAVSCHCRCCCQLLDYSLQRGCCKFLPSLSSSPSLPPSLLPKWVVARRRECVCTLFIGPTAHRGHLPGAHHTQLLGEIQQGFAERWAGGRFRGSQPLEDTQTNEKVFFRGGK